MTPILEVSHLCKSYPSFKLDDICFSLEEGKITGFIGRNGAGKTTTLHSLLSFIAPDSGDIRFWGLDMREHEQEIKQRIGFVSAGMSFYSGKKLETITQVTRSFYPNWDEECYRRRMRQFSLESDKTPDKLSNGMKIKYMLTLALSHQADLFILDEPTSGLDPVSREELLEIFLSLCDEGKTILFSTHITSDLDKTADNILYLAGGRLKAADSLERFIDSYRLVRTENEDEDRAIRAFQLGTRRVKGGHTVLIRREDAAKISLTSELVTLDDIMVHLEKEDVQ